MTSTRAIDQHRTVLASMRAALEAIPADLHGAFNDELAELLSEVDSVVAAASGLRAEVVLETKTRGVMTDSGLDTRGWIIRFAPTLRQAGAGPLAKLVDTVARRTNIQAGCDYDDTGLPFNRRSPLAIIWESARAGEAGAPLAMSLLREMDQLQTRLYPDAVPTVTEGMLLLGVQHGPAMMRQMRIHLLAEHGLPDEVERVQGELDRHAFLSSPQPESGGLTRYSMGLTPEQSAILEAALGPLAKPRPNPETGDRDLRSNSQRRAEALTEMCQRLAATDAARRGGPAESDTCVYVTVALTDLENRSGAGEILGSRADGTLIGIDTIRKMCCDADLIPVVLGTDAEAIDHGMTVRLFTRAQRRAVWRRDRHCTFPGCEAPGAWTKVHHVRHWADGGPTDLANAALLCQRHHSFVHQQGLWAEVNPKPDDAGRYVVWNLVRGSYRHAALEQGWARGWQAA
ncbi:MAG TPA: DUF222 domain-containing protein [Intrasporangiaceae bacterium]|nr:DUF222 domain-containing protein [Intrasporangiaceae bacterium]